MNKDFNALTIEIMSSLIESNRINETKTNDVNVKKAKEIMMTMKEEIISGDVNKGYTGNVSIGAGNKSNAQWIGIYDPRSEKFGQPNCLAIAIIFYAEINSIFITISGSSKNMTQKQLVEFWEFNKQLVQTQDLGIDNELVDKYADTNEEPVQFLANEPKTGLANSYIYSSLFSKLINGKDKTANFNNVLSEILEIYTTMMNKIDLNSYYEAVEKIKEGETVAKVVRREVTKFIKLDSKEGIDVQIEMAQDFLKLNMDRIEKTGISSKEKKKINRIKATESRKRMKETGDEAEAIVMRYEQETLQNKGLLELANKVEILETDGDGYDILSFNEDGTEKWIEVKGTKGNVGYFDISLRELEIASNENWNIYYVEKVGTLNPIIYRIDKTNLNKNNLIPISFRAFIE